jgi:hypothetical protein
MLPSCVLWGATGGYNVTIYGDYPDQTFPGYCAKAKQKLGMHEAGPASGAVSCDMTRHRPQSQGWKDPQGGVTPPDYGGGDTRFIFRETVSRTYFDCDRAQAFFAAMWAQ